LTVSATTQDFLVKANSLYPNNRLPVLHYRQVLHIPVFFAAMKIKRLFKKNNWGNNWRSGIFTFHHYHSNTHEAMAVLKGKTRLQLGGENGIRITIRKGDIVVIPAGVAHKNLGNENSVICIGGYPEGRAYDIKYGIPEERPQADRNIAAVPIPVTGPLKGKDDDLLRIWKK
jgi:uncharacterized protein YjlB